MKLIKPTLEYAKSWKESLTEFENENIEGFWNVFEKPTNAKDYIKTTDDNSKGINLPENWVPSTTYWLIDRGEFIGHINIRHKLTEKLALVAGHIGYAIRPTKRQQGYGSKILELTLPKAKEIGLNKALITCDIDNIASKKIIEKNGGKLEDQVETDEGHKLRYWISL